MSKKIIGKKIIGKDFVMTEENYAIAKAIIEVQEYARSPEWREQSLKECRWYWDDTAEAAKKVVRTLPKDENKELKQWNDGDHAIYTPNGFIPYLCYNTEQVDFIVKKNKELIEREAKLVQELKDIECMASKTD